MTPSHPTPYSLAILAGLQSKRPLFQGKAVNRTPVNARRVTARRQAHRDAVAARSATASRKDIS